MSFDDLKRAMLKLQALNYYDIKLPIQLVVDASPMGLGVILTQSNKHDEITSFPMPVECLQL